MYITKVPLMFLMFFPGERVELPKVIREGLFYGVLIELSRKIWKILD